MSDEADCQKKYIARCLFCKLARDISKEYCKGPFKLYCDDLRPDNILVDASRLAVTGVVDWEFTYAAPWWLLLEKPEDWESDLDKFLERFTPRFQTFLEVLKDCENKQIQDRSLSQSQRLSIAMEKSFERGLFWICLASRHGSLCLMRYIGNSSIQNSMARSRQPRIDLLCSEQKNERILTLLLRSR